jgi:hypothetical protein
MEDTWNIFSKDKDMEYLIPNPINPKWIIAKTAMTGWQII